MSRSRHARPSAPSSDPDMSRITNAAIGVADAFIRFEREFARLQRTMTGTGLEHRDITAAVNLAARGRPDRAKALAAVIERVGRTA